MAMQHVQEFNVHTRYPTDTFLLKTRVTVNGENTQIKSVREGSYEEPTLVYGINISAKLWLIANTISPILHKFGVYHMDTFYYEQSPLFHVVFSSEACLKKFLREMEMITYAMQVKILSVLLKSDSSQGLFVEVHPELFLVFPNLQIMTGADLHLVTVGNFSAFAAHWKNNNLFDFGVTEQNLHILTEILRPAAPQWRRIGGALGIPEYDLNIIQHNQVLTMEGPPGYLRVMLSQWLKWAPPNHPWPTIEALTLAIQSTEHEGLALNLKSLFLQKKCTGSQMPGTQQTVQMQHQIDQLATPSIASLPHGTQNTQLQQQQPQRNVLPPQKIVTAGSHQPLQVPGTSLRSQHPTVSDFFPLQVLPDGGLDKEPFDHYEVYPPENVAEMKLSSDTGVPDAIVKRSANPGEEGNEIRATTHGVAVNYNFSLQERTDKVPQDHSNTSSSFPHLDMGKLSKQDKLALQCKLLKDFDVIYSEFSDLIHYTITSTANRVSVSELSNRLNSLGCYRPIHKSTPLLQNQLDKIKRAEDVEKVFCVLGDYYSFFNYGIIEKIVSWFGTQEDKKRLEAYTEHFKRFCKRRTFECPSNIFGHLVDEGKTNLVVKVEESWDPTDGCSLENILRLRNSLSEILEVESETLYLCQIDKGCVELLFQVPSFVEEDIFPLTMEQQRSLASIGVPRLTCGRYSYFQLLSPQLSSHDENQVQQKCPLESETQQTTEMRQLQEELQTLRIKVDASQQQVLERDSEIDRLRKQQKACATHGLQLPLKLKWRQCRDMPCAMKGLQSVTVRQEVYVGGGYTDTPDVDGACTVYKYDEASNKWESLPRYNCRWFAMAILNGKVTLVGGFSISPPLVETKEVAVLEGEGMSQKWTHPYPPMSTPRESPAVATYQDRLVVAGGRQSGANLATVEILDTTSQQWLSASPLPVECHSMTSAIANQELFLLGGTLTTEALVVSLPDITWSSVHSATTNGVTQWLTLPAPPLMNSAAISIYGSVLAIGGRHDNRSSTAIYIYQPATKKWSEVGDLPSTRYDCSCTILPSGDILIVGGFDSNDKRISQVDAATLIPRTL